MKMSTSKNKFFRHSLRTHRHKIQTLSKHWMFSTNQIKTIGTITQRQLM